MSSPNPFDEQEKMSDAASSRQQWQQDGAGGGASSSRSETSRGSSSIGGGGGGGGGSGQHQHYQQQHQQQQQRGGAGGSVGGGGGGSNASGSVGGGGGRSTHMVASGRASQQHHRGGSSSNHPQQRGRAGESPVMSATMNTRGPHNQHPPHQPHGGNNNSRPITASSVSATSASNAVVLPPPPPQQQQQRRIPPSASHVQHQQQQQVSAAASAASSSNSIMTNSSNIGQQHRPPDPNANTRTLHHQPHGVAAIGPSSSNISSSTSMNQQLLLQQQQQQQQAHHQHFVSVESPLPAIVQRSLGDRSNEKRKNAALEIEALIKSLQEANNIGMIQSVITVLSKDFCLSMNSNYRKGGLVGLAATAIGLMHNSRHFLDSLLPPVLHCFDDPESRVRYYACESLYNIAKVSRQSVLPNYFGDIWEGLSKLFADVDVDVKNGANLLDRLIKDIVTEADNFHVDQFLPLLQAYIRRTNPYIRQLIVGWITLLDSIPDISMLDYLPDFLDGLLNMLSDSNREIRSAADGALSEFLRELAVSTVVELGPIVSILVTQCQSKERLNRLTAITWLTELIHHPYSGGDALLPFHAQVLGAILYCIPDHEKDIKLVAERTNDDLLELVRGTRASFELKRMLETLTNELLKEDVPTKMACLRWINMLMGKRKSDMNEFTESLLPVLLRTLSDPSDMVVLLDLQVLSRISLAERDTLGFAEEREEMQFRLVLNAILNLFAQDRQLLETRGSLIIRKLCVLLNAKSVYIRMADTLSSYGEKARKKQPDLQILQFVGTMVQTLNLILLTASELHDLRATLAKSFQKTTTAATTSESPTTTTGTENNKDGAEPNDEEDDDGLKVFVTLFHCWCHNPIATFSLCLLAQAYDLSFALVKRFSEMSSVNVGFLMQIDKLVQLLESPMFVHLRLKLLDVEADYHAPLLKSIYGLLMCLPQGSAFTLLNDRLTTVCNLRDNLGISPTNPAAGGSTDDDNYSIVGKTGLSLEKLLDRFDEVSEQYREAIAYSQQLELEREQQSSGGIENSITIHGSGVGGSNSGGASAPRWGSSSGGSTLSDHAVSQAAAVAASPSSSTSMFPSTSTSGAATSLGSSGPAGASHQSTAGGGSNTDRGASRSSGVGGGSSTARRPYPPTTR